MHRETRFQILMQEYKIASHMKKLKQPIQYNVTGFTLSGSLSVLDNFNFVPHAHLSTKK